MIKQSPTNDERPLVDAASLALAEHFLQDESTATEDDTWNLAAAIQRAVEDWFDSRERAESLTAMGAES